LLLELFHSLANCIIAFINNRNSFMRIVGG
jgi:hypothetical protein